METIDLKKTNGHVYVITEDEKNRYDFSLELKLAMQKLSNALYSPGTHVKVVFYNEDNEVPNIEKNMNNSTCIHKYDENLYYKSAKKLANRLSIGEQTALNLINKDPIFKRIVNPFKIGNRWFCEKSKVEEYIKQAVYDK